MKTLRSPLRLTGIGAVAVLVGLVACTPAQQPVKRVVKDESQRKHAPDFALKDANGKLVHLTDFKGKVVVLDFWATWCNPCMVEIPWFQEFERKYKDRGFEVVGVSMDDDGWKAINPFVAKRKLNYRVVLGDDKTGDQYGGLEALPTTFVIDRNGRIASAHVGLPLAGKKDFEDAIQQLLEAPALPDNGGAVRSDARRPDGPDSGRHRATHG